MRDLALNGENGLLGVRVLKPVGLVSSRVHVNVQGGLSALETVNSLKTVNRVHALSGVLGKTGRSVQLHVVMANKLALEHVAQEPVVQVM